MTRKLDDLIATLPQEEQAAIQREAEHQIAEEVMRRTRSFRDTVQARGAEDAVFWDALSEEVIDALATGNVGTARALLRDYITKHWPKP